MWCLTVYFIVTYYNDLFIKTNKHHDYPCKACILKICSKLVFIFNEELNLLSII